MLNCNAHNIEFSGVPAEIIDDIAYSILGLAVAGVEEIDDVVSFDEVLYYIVAELDSRISELKNLYCGLSDDERAALILEH